MPLRSEASAKWPRLEARPFSPLLFHWNGWRPPHLPWDSKIGWTPSIPGEEINKLNCPPSTLSAPLYTQQVKWNSILKYNFTHLKVAHTTDKWRDWNLIKKPVPTPLEKWRHTFVFNILWASPLFFCFWARLLFHCEAVFIFVRTNACCCPGGKK